jgi:hypothetical protein
MKEHTREYYMKHRAKLDAMKKAVIEQSVLQTAHTRMEWECECGRIVHVKNIQFHFCSDVHRAICGDIQD